MSTTEEKELETKTESTGEAEHEDRKHMLVARLHELADKINEMPFLTELEQSRYDEVMLAMENDYTLGHSDFMSGFVTALGFTFRCIVTDHPDGDFRVRIANIESGVVPTDDHILGEVVVKRPEVNSKTGTPAERSAVLTATSMSVSQALYQGVKPITPCPMPPQHLSVALSKIDEMAKKKLKKNKGLRETYEIIETYMHPWLAPGEMALINRDTGEAQEIAQETTA